MEGTPRNSSVDQESLFSLELVVDKLSIPNVACRFPAVAFRLLDFPTLVIYHVEPDLAESIKKKIALDPHYRLPGQLHELKDKSGDFPVKKGKSCLFKVTAQTLQSHLQNTPLYVMIMDTFPETPKLVGSCLVPLDVIVDKIFTDICKLGVATPAVHGERGDYQVYNLMGSPIGELALGFRLLSLGMGLISHIPDHAIQRIGKSREVKCKEEDALATKVKNTTDVVLHDLESADKNIQVVISDPAPSTAHIDTQTERNVLLTSGSQTVKDTSVKKKSKISQRPSTEGFSDFFITNTVCPPPLFYNSHAEPQLSEGLQFYDDINSVAVAQAKYSTGIFETNDEDDDSSDDTIRTEDKFSDSDNEQHVDFKSAKVVHTPVKRVKDVGNEKSLKKPPPQITNAVNFPLLNALMKEILNLQNVQGEMPQEKSQSIPGTPKKEPIPYHSAPSTPRTKGQDAKENRDEFLARLATPRGTAAMHESVGGGKRTHRICGPGDQSVPKNKSWIRSVPTHSVKKTKLAYGMTNTQRLRLAKGNPELLKTLEEAEQIRQEKRKVQKQDLSGREVEKGKVKSNVPGAAGIMGKEIQDMPKNHDKMFMLERTGDSEVRGSSEFRLSKRPVPTPRKSLKGEKEVHLLQESGAILGRLWNNYSTDFDLPNIQDQAEEPSFKDSEASGIKKNIEVHIPSSSAHDDTDAASDATGLDQSDFADEQPKARQLGTTKTIYNPGFPADIPVKDKAFDPQYSDDFETSGPPADFMMEPGLRRVVDQYSDDEDNSEKSVSRSYHSAHSVHSNEKYQRDLKLKMPHLPNPTTSNLSPQQPVSKYSANGGPDTRRPMAPSASVEPGMGESVDSSTAYISRSQVASQSYDTGTSMDSTGRPARRPTPTPRRQWSVHTESVSSYAPSDGERMSPIEDASDTEGDYSEAFEDISEDDPEIIAKDMKDLKISKGVRLGYTWAPG